MDTLSQLGMISTPEVGFYLTRTESGSELVFGSPHNKYVKDKVTGKTVADLFPALTPIKTKRLLCPKSPPVTVFIVLPWMASFLMATWCEVQTAASVWRILRLSLILGRL